MSTAVVWFRRDLRVHDHPALHRAAAEHGCVVPLFVLDDRLLQGRFASLPRTAFMLGCLRALDAELQARGSRLVVRRGRPEDEVPRLAEELGADEVTWTSDVSPFARRRDREVTERLAAIGAAAAPQGGNYVVDVSKPKTRAGEPFGVFSPFQRAWAQEPRRTVRRAPRELPAVPRLDSAPLPAAQAAPNPFAEPGEPAGRAALERWLRAGIDRYADRENGVARQHTSGLSPYLRWGCLSPRECEERARRHGGAGAEAWIRQLAWRDFYAHVLLHHPDNLRHEHQPRFRRLPWGEDEGVLAAWREGRTGFPLVDAGMRQLAEQGWMPNRVRLVTGSFLTKDLHLDWRAGELHFERHLLDGEPAQNNGNWQWVASVGVDPAPAYGGSSIRRSRPGSSTRTATTSAAGCPSWPISRPRRSTTRRRWTARSAATRSRSSTTSPSAAWRSTGSRRPRASAGAARSTLDAKGCYAPQR